VRGLVGQLGCALDDLVHIFVSLGRYELLRRGRALLLRLGCSVSIAKSYRFEVGLDPHRVLQLLDAVFEH